MTSPDHVNLTRQKLLKYFEEAFTPLDRWQVGMELEKMGRDGVSARPIPYDGRVASVRGVLERYRDLRSGDPIFEGEHLIGLDGPWGTISLEPAGQVEWSSKPCASLDALHREADAHLRVLDRVGRDLEIDWLDVAVDPVHAVSEMPWMPKARYGIMRPYLGRRGRLAHRMMTQTASIQCAFDFSDGDDWTRKFRAAALLSPVAVALFANSSRVDGADSGYRSYRQVIWRETDPDRCGLPPVVFESGFGIEAWVDWLCRVPALFIRRARGLVPSGGTPFCKLQEATGCDALKMEDWELHLSSVFTDVRSYAYIEVRTADLLPDPVSFAVPTFWTGLLYHSGSLEAALDLGAPVDDYGKWVDAMDSAARLGFDGVAGGVPLREMATRAVLLSVAGLEDGAACTRGLTDPAGPLRELAGETGLTLPG